MTNTPENHASDTERERDDVSGLTLADAILIRALADGDSAWLPQRRHGHPVSAATIHARREFVLRGVPWRSEARTEAAAKACERSLKGLTAHGFTRVYVSGIAKTTSISVSPSGELYARRLCGLPDELSAWLVAREIAALTVRDLRPWPPHAPGSKRTGSTIDQAWLSERALMDPDRPAGREAAVVESMALPYLRRRLIVALSDGAGRVCYALTPTGWSLLDDPANEPAEVEYDGDRAARAIYDDRLAETLAKLGHTAPPGPAARDIGDIPLPVAYVGAELSRCYLPAHVADMGLSRGAAELQHAGGAVPPKPRRRSQGRRGAKRKVSKHG